MYICGIALSTTIIEIATEFTILMILYALLILVMYNILSISYLPHLSFQPTQLSRHFCHLSLSGLDPKGVPLTEYALSSLAGHSIFCCHGPLPWKRFNTSERQKVGGPDPSSHSAVLFPACGCRLSQPTHATCRITLAFGHATTPCNSKAQQKWQV